MMMDYLENDCSNDKYRYIEISHYYTDGTKDSNNMELIKIWSYVTTDTIQSLVNDYLCRGK